MGLRIRRIISILGLGTAVVLWGCSSAGIDRITPGGLKGKKSEKDEDSEDEPGADLETETDAEASALSDEEAVAFLQDNCASCHGKGADLHSTWPMPAQESLNVDTLQGMTTIAAAYQGMLHKYVNALSGQRPSAMPPGPLGGESRRRLEGMLYWFKINMPAVVKEAEDTYGASDRFRSTLSVNLNYQCDSRTSARNYLYRLFNQALGRTPTAEEVEELLPKPERDAPLTDARRDKLAEAVVNGTYQSQFFDFGLKIFAQRVGGSGSIRVSEAFGINAATAGDLKSEFYQLLRKYVEDKPYRDILLMNKVMVTANTARLYHEDAAPCTAPEAGSWAECELSEKRSNFFGTVGFLKSAPSSFLASNNNYKRGGEIHAILRGERLMAQTDGPAGDKPGPIPECIPTQDRRVVLSDPANPGAGKAPRGAMAVPAEGAVCQGCHLHKYLAVASFVYRPFDENGLALTSAQINTNAQNPYADLVKMAVSSEIQNLTDPGAGTLAAVSPEYLHSLLAENDQAQEQCIADRTGSKSLAQVKNIGDLTGYMVGDGSVLIHGLARYIPSALSNIPLTNQEIIANMSRGFSAGEGRLLPVFKAYFQSETFACAVGDQ